MEYYLRKLLCMQIGKGDPLGKTCRANIELNWLYPTSVWPTLRVGHKTPMNKKILELNIIEFEHV